MNLKKKLIGQNTDQTDWIHVDALTDKTIDYSDNPATDENFWKDAKFAHFKLKKKSPITIRLDDDIVEWFKKRTEMNGGRGYQTYMNAVLRTYTRLQWELKNN